MNKLSIDFAFEGFRIIRERPWVIPFWGLFLLLVNAGSMLAMSTLMGPGVAALQSIAKNPGDTTATLALMAQAAPVYLVLIPVTILVQSILSCAVYRCVLTGEEAGFGYLRLGVAEFRQILVYFLFAFIVLGIYLGCAIAGFAMMFVVTLVLGLISKGLAGLGAVIAGIVMIFAFFLIMARLSLFSVQSFEQKKVNLFGSWSLTAGYSWTLFGGYLIMYIMIVLVWLLCVGIFAAVAAALAGGDFKAVSPIFNGSMMGLDAFRQPMTLIYMGIMNLLVAPLIIALFQGAPAAAYKALAGVGRQKVENIF